MRLKIHHATHYEYESQPHFVVQRLHLLPSDFDGQQTIQWDIKAPGIEKALCYRDGFGNWVHLLTPHFNGQQMTITAEGIVETSDKAGVVRGLAVSTPEAIFLRTTPLTTADRSLQKLLAHLPQTKTPLDRAHAIMQAVHAAVAYDTDATEASTTAAEAFSTGRGVCQDHTHIMLALARLAGIPARYVQGYLVTGIGASSTASHAWAELFIQDLGWVGFDATNGQCPTDHYVRVAAGLDATAVAPIRGLRRGMAGHEHMKVEVRVEISQQ